MASRHSLNLVNIYSAAPQNIPYEISSSEIWEFAILIQDWTALSIKFICKEFNVEVNVTLSGAYIVFSTGAVCSSIIVILSLDPFLFLFWLEIDFFIGSLLEILDFSDHVRDHSWLELWSNGSSACWTDACGDFRRAYDTKGVETVKLDRCWLKVVADGTGEDLFEVWDQLVEFCLEKLYFVFSEVGEFRF